MFTALLQLFGIGMKLLYGILIAFLLGWIGLIPTIIGSVIAVIAAVYSWLVTLDEHEGFGTLIILARIIAFLLVICVMWLSYLIFSGGLHSALIWIAGRLPK